MALSQKFMTAKVDPAEESSAQSAFPWKTLICSWTKQSCERHFGEQLSAVILTGSLARDEGSFLDTRKKFMMLGDAEFLLVFQARSLLPDSKAIESVRREIESSLEERGLICSIGLSAVRTTYLLALTPAIYAYELRFCGQVIAGDVNTMALIPEFSPGEIPVEDGWRLLCNRIVEHVKPLDCFGETRGLAPWNDQYRTVKLYLDMATSLLLFLREYAPSYKERCRLLSNLAGIDMAPGAFPFPLGPFAKRVAVCTEWKLSPTPRAEFDDAQSLKMAVQYARALWRWELISLLGGICPVADLQLMGRWMERQPMRTRLRGWARVARKLGMRHLLRDGPRWARLVRDGSPRYWLYAAACPLFFWFHLDPGADTDPPSDIDWDGARQWLPLVSEKSQPGEAPWKTLARDITRNYQQFLVGTRT